MLVGEPKIEMQKRQVCVGGFGLFEFSQSFLIVAVSEQGLAHQQMKLRRVAADFNQPPRRLLVEILVTGIESGDSKNIEVDELIGHFAPQRRKGFGGLRVIAYERVAEAQQITSLLRVGLVAQHGGKRSDGVGIVAALVFDKPDVEAYADHFRVEFLRLAEFSKCQLPILAAHGDHAQVGPCRGGVRIHFEDLTKERLRRIELSGREGLLARQEDGGGIGRSVLPGLKRGSESQYQKRRRAGKVQPVRQETSPSEGS